MNRERFIRHIPTMGCIPRKSHGWRIVSGCIPKTTATGGESIPSWAFLFVFSLLMAGRIASAEPPDQVKGMSKEDAFKIDPRDAKGRNQGYFKNIRGMLDNSGKASGTRKLPPLPRANQPLPGTEKAAERPHRKPAREAPLRRIDCLPAPDVCCYSICRDDSSGDWQRIGPEVAIEQSSEVTFKVEGYKPYGSGDGRQELRSLGTIGNFGEIRVNMIGLLENIDEDADGVAAGFPGSMFETAAHQLQVLWCIDQIDGINTDDDSKVTRVVVKDAAPNCGGDQKNFVQTFAQAGNYRVYAKFRYNYFQYSGNWNANSSGELVTTARSWPSSDGYVTTRKVLYRVQPPSLLAGPGMISNIVLQNQTFVQGLEGVAEIPDRFLIAENDRPRQLKFSYHAQFVKDATMGDPKVSLTNFAGIGVWDYGDREGHVYNYAGPHEYNEAFNPGSPQPMDDQNRASHGTRVDLPPNREKDLKAIRWRLFLCPDGKDGKQAGEQILDGDCSNASLEPLLQERRFKITVAIPDAELALKLPRRASAYLLRLEIEYPRVRWTEIDQGKGEQAPVRSIIPDERPRGVVSNWPGSADGVIYECDSDAGAYFANGDTWHIQIWTQDMVNQQQQAAVAHAGALGEMVQTSGDPLASASLTFELPVTTPTMDPAGFVVTYEIPSSSRDLELKTLATGANLVRLLAPNSTDPAGVPVSQVRKKAPALYLLSLPDYGDDNGTSKLFSPGSEYQNWVGSLTCWGEIGSDKVLGASATARFAAKKSGNASEPEKLLKTNVFSLQRFDNDPPSLKMTIVSPSDNRRWDISLEEGVKDLEPKPETVAGLASGVLRVSCLTSLPGASEPTILASGVMEVPGSSHSPFLLDLWSQVNPATLPSLEPGLLAALPRVSRSGRLLINIDLDDNVEVLALSLAKLEVLEIREAQSPLNLMQGKVAQIPLMATVLKDGRRNPDLPSPRARFNVDMPAVVLPEQKMPQKTQLVIKLTAADAAGNERSLVIPVQLVPTTFQATVLNSKEGKK